MPDRVHVSRMRIVQKKRPLRLAYVEGVEQPIPIGLHAGVKHLYTVPFEENLPSTLDYVAAGVAGCMTGVLAGALEGRHIPSHPDKLTCEVQGIFENVDGKALLTKIHLKYRLKVSKGKADDARRALQIHGDHCPASLSVKRGIEVDWDFELTEE